MNQTIETLQQRIRELENEVVTLRVDQSRDKLTKCLRREAFSDLIASRKTMGFLPRNCSVLVLDVDHFKKVNDTYGHCMGDNVLKKLSEILRSACDTSVIVSRWGGEEFVILVEHDKNSALQFAEDLRKQIENSPIKINLLESLKVTVSIGHAQWDTDMPFEEAFVLADQALYQAKRGGRNQVAA